MPVPSALPMYRLVESRIECPPGGLVLNTRVKATRPAEPKDISRIPTTPGRNWRAGELSTGTSNPPFTPMREASGDQEIANPNTRPASNAVRSLGFDPSAFVMTMGETALIASCFPSGDTATPTTSRLSRSAEESLLVVLSLVDHKKTAYPGPPMTFSRDR